MSPAAPRAQSLAQRLGRSLTLAVVPVWLLSTALVATYVNGEIQHNFDVELVESAHRQLYPALLEVDRAQPMALDEPLLMRTQPGPAHSEPLLLQLRGANGQVLLRSVATPASAFAVPLQAGFYETDDYRVFSLHDEVSGAWLQLADPLSERREASQRTVIGLVLVLLVMLPVLAWVITVVARRQLRTLEQLQQQITARSGSNLQPLELADMPLELCAVGDGVNQLLERLGEALNVERSLAANAAHELRTPLAEVRLRLQTAVDRAVADGGSAGSSGQVPLDDVRQALRSLATLSHRTERLLQLSRAEGGDVAHFGRVNLVQLAEQVAQEFWQQDAARKRLDCLVPEDQPAVWVEGDLDGLAIVLRNLVDNALHYTQGPVELQVLATPQPTLSVRDHGPGLSPEALAQMQQRHARIGSHHIGYGLGMSIVRSIADKHAAELVLTSPPTEGGSGLSVRLVFAKAAAARD